jgi:DNA repair protein RadC
MPLAFLMKQTINKIKKMNSTTPPTAPISSVNTLDNIDIIDISYKLKHGFKISDWPVIWDSWDAFEIFRQYRNLCTTHIPEEVIALFLNHGNRLLHACRLCHGKPGATFHNFRMILSEALRVGACSIVIMHKHPRDLQAKTEQEFAKKLKNAAAHFDITLFDYLMIGDCTYFPLAKYGII